MKEMKQILENLYQNDNIFRCKLFFRKIKNIASDILNFFHISFLILIFLVYHKGEK